MLLSYLCLYKRIQDWDSPQLALEIIKRKCKWAQPNINLVKRFLEVNEKLQATQTSAPPSETKSERSSKYHYIDEKQSIVDEKYIMGDIQSISEPPAPESF